MLSSSLGVAAIALAAIMPTTHFDHFAVVSAFNHHQQQHQQHQYRQYRSRVPYLQQQQQQQQQPQRPSSAMTVILQADSSSGSSDFDRPSTFLDENDEDEGATDINIVWLDEEDEEDEDGPTVFDAATAKTNNDNNNKKKSRWEKLNPKIKQKIIEKGQAKAIANKAKREPAQQKKRRE